MVANINNRIKFLLLVFIFNSCFSFGQVGNWNFDHFSYKDGLASNEIFNMIQDDDGYIWIATSEGLNRYNGTSFKQYKHKPIDSNSISDGEIWGMLETSQFIWMGSGSGELNKYDKESGKFKSYPINNKEVRWNYQIWEIVAEGDSILWLAMERGLCKFHINKGISKVFLPTSTNAEMKDIMYNVFYCLDRNRRNDDELLLGCRAGLLIFDKKEERFRTNPWYNKKNIIKMIYIRMRIV